ncbi:thioesterase domain-containing protein [Streptomyces sp. ITFR-6]|uniref:thioesterase II family protein n=1 Tax=Streptomyces sp. ITFR-6 TaxID=3075197 RepID=UPI00288B0A04|nr:thioesterase domain-containing protein [Streptomyces sp. ITFR-6]WNI32320.1 alpha/beta fold hydrolase [Streptomyces sp. ITFR-6]
MTGAVFTAESPWIRRSARAAPAVRLICMPYAGAGASVYRAWPGLLPDSVEVLALQPPGREDRAREDPPVDLRALVRACAIALRPFCTGRFVLYGHCAGALLAHDVAHEMARRFDVRPRRLIAAAQPAPYVASAQAPLYELPDEEFTEAVRLRGGLPRELLANPDMLEFLLPMLRADFALWERYEHERRPALPCPVTTLRGRDDPVVSGDLARTWRECTEQGHDHHEVDGGHYFVNRMTRGTARTIAHAVLAE